MRARAASRSICNAAGDVVNVSVADNGKGLGERNESESARFGLMGMRERVQALGGEFQLDSRPGNGLTVTASIPVRAVTQERAQQLDTVAR